MDRRPAAGDTATIGMIDLQEANRFIPLTTTRAWNFQQGCMLHWISGGREVLFNDRRDGRFVCVAHEVATGRQRVIGPATADVTWRPGGEAGRTPLELRDQDKGKLLAATLNFARIAVTRPGYGYEGLEDPFADRNVTDQDGLGILDLATGRHRLILSYSDLLPHQPASLRFGSEKVYFNHVLFNPSGTRLAVIVRQVVPPRGWWTQLWTVGAAGEPLVRVLEGPMVSHYDWKDDDTVMAWAGVDGRDGVYEFDCLGRDKPRLLFGEAIRRDGHVAYSHNRGWVVTDTYPHDADGTRRLSILEYATGLERPLGRYYSPITRGLDDIRCDFHPSWSEDDRQLAFDGMHEGTRQRYVIDLES